MCNLDLECVCKFVPVMPNTSGRIIFFCFPGIKMDACEHDLDSCHHSRQELGRDSCHYFPDGWPTGIFAGLVV